MVTAQAQNSSRLVALDVARAFAIMGMVVVNVGPYTDDGVASIVVRAFNGRAAILFVILAGIGVAFLTRRASSGGVAWQTSLAWRGSLLLLLGMGLQLMNHDANVILATYAALFFASIWAVKLPTRWLLITAVIATFLGPVIWLAAQQLIEEPIAPAEFGDTPWQVLSSIFVTGPYPLVVWVAPFLLGLWLGRIPLGQLRVKRLMITLGTLAAVVGLVVSDLLVWLAGHPNLDEAGWDRLVASYGHSQMPLWVISASGSAVLVLGILLMLTPWMGRFAGPLRTMGTMPLTVYTLHLVLIAVFLGGEAANTVAGLFISAGIILVLLVFALWWNAYQRYGPLEYVLRHPPRFLQSPVTTHRRLRHRRRHYREPDRHHEPDLQH